MAVLLARMAGVTLNHYLVLMEVGPKELVAFIWGLNSPVPQDFISPFVVKVKKISLLKFIHFPPKKLI